MYDKYVVLIIKQNTARINAEVSAIILSCSCLYTWHTIGPITWKHNLIHKTRGTYYNTIPPEEDQTMATGTVWINLVKFGGVVFKICEWRLLKHTCIEPVDKIFGLFVLIFVSTSFVVHSVSVTDGSYNLQFVSLQLSQCVPSPPSQHPLYPAGQVPTHLAPFLLCLIFSFGWPLCAFTIYICLPTLEQRLLQQRETKVGLV